MNGQVSPLDILNRVNRELEKKDRKLVKCEHLCRSCMALGDYYLMDTTQNLLIDTNVDLEKVAREEGCLADGEVIEVDADS